MANYQLKYQCSFDSLVSENYTIQILQKDYTGNVINVTGAGTPVVQEYQTDDPNAPIKGSSLNITLINDGTLPLESFYSVDDDEFKVVFMWGTTILWQGFIVQDDCSEIMVDYTHEINLSVTDNLGLLKNLSLSKSDSAFAYTSVGEQQITATPDHTLVVPSVVGNQVQPGDSIKIVGGAAASIYPYSVKTVTDNGATFTITFVEDIVSYTGLATLFIGKLALLDKKPLLNILGMCLGLTGLELQIFVWGQINETSQDQTQSFLTQTLIDPQTFMNDDGTYMDCYTVLTYILSSFKFTLFQSNGAWNLVRWDELRNFDQMTAFVFNSDLTVYGYSALQTPFNVGLGKTNYPETGLLHRIIRPFSFEKETFNYRQPPQLLRNYDLNTLGTLLRTYTVNVWLWSGNVYYSYDDAKYAVRHSSGHLYDIKATFYKYREYSALWWYQNDITPGDPDYFIRVITDSIDQEIERRVVLKNLETYDYIKSFPIEANTGDIFKFSFTARTSKYPQRTPLFISVLVQLVGPTDTKIVSLNNAPFGFFKTVKVAEWVPIATGLDLLDSFIYQIPNGTPDTEFTVDIDLTYAPIPNDGLLYFNLSTEIYYQNGTEISPPSMSHIDEITYKDIRLSYIPLINQTTKITGQYHDNDQGQIIKNNSDTEIFVDTSPRNSICGTLFLNQLDGILQKRAAKWGHPYIAGQSENLGELVTFEDLLWRSKPRSILDGIFYGLINTQAVPNGCALLINLDPLAGTETAAISFTSTPPGTTGVTVSYFNGKWNDVPGDTTSPKTLNLTAGNYVFKITFVGSGVTYYFTPQTQHFSLLSVLNFSQINSANFVPGLLSIDFKNNKFTGTLYEMAADDTMSNDYTFNYIYSPI